MTRQLLIIISFWGLVSCKTTTDSSTIINNADSLTNDTVKIKYSFDTTLTINNIVFKFSIKDLNADSVILTATSTSLTAINDTINSNGLAYWEFPDINKDGNVDFIYDYIGNNPIIFAYLFDTVTNSFINVDGFEKFPEAVQLKSNPKYYYSYHRAGCADLNWVSDLFKIENFKTIQAGHIYGQGCDFEVKENPQVIEIYKVKDNDEINKKLIENLPYQKPIKNFEDKWDFIDTYWNKNYGQFE
ncbi:MAG: hypothetical protein KGZ37_02475 [Nitrosarchaeum sp.]|nr:hypothetical protein [Nitrosarchaeum sp.]